MPWPACFQAPSLFSKLEVSHAVTAINHFQKVKEQQAGAETRAGSK